MFFVSTEVLRGLAKRWRKASAQAQQYANIQPQEKHRYAKGAEADAWLCAWRELTDVLYAAELLGKLEVAETLSDTE